MAANLPTSIKMSQVRTTLSRADSAKISFNETEVRMLAEKPTGRISIKDLIGKTPVPVIKTDIGTSKTAYITALGMDPTVVFEAFADGTWEIYGGSGVAGGMGANIDAGTWCTGTPGNGEFEVMFTPKSDSNANGIGGVTYIANTWMPLGSSYSNSLKLSKGIASNSTIELNDVFTFEFAVRRAGDDATKVVTTISFDITAQISNNS
jgi:hypothetical protein